MAERVPQARRQSRRSGFPIVAIGTSSGGLDAVRSFLDAQSPDSGMAFALIHHVDPGHPRLQADMLARHTKMAVSKVEDGALIERDHVYLAPSGTSISSDRGRWRLSRPVTQQSEGRPFDVLLQSLAATCGPSAAGIVLSGTGDHGKQGLRDLREKGGLAIVQSPEEATFDEMPRMAIAIGAADIIAPVSDIPAALFRHFRSTAITAAVEEGPSGSAENADVFSAVISLVGERTSHDFTLYKRGTLERRLRQRMISLAIDDPAAYLERLRGTSDEAGFLFTELVINVTHFFRDLAAFDALSAEIYGNFIPQQPADQPFRIWVPGCSSGEEAYSVAILFLEAVHASQRPLKLQVFASDISPQAVVAARAGLFPEAIRAHVSPERLARFFAPEEGGYRISRELREAVVFTVHNILTDPPFPRLDLISCRNLLIYLQPEAQRKALSLFHLALRDGGILFLGKSETVESTDWFAPISKVHGIFRHVASERSGEIAFSAAAAIVDRSVAASSRPLASRAQDFAHLARDALVDAFAPASVLINANYDSLYFFGPIDSYLRIPAGSASPQLITMLRAGLRPKLRAVVERTKRDRLSHSISPALIERAGSTVRVEINVRPVQHGGRSLFLVSFADLPAPHGDIDGGNGIHADASRVGDLEQRLDDVTAELELTIADLESSNLEQKAANEEALSLNGELIALNRQLLESLDRQRGTSDDLRNILESSGIATIFLDLDLRIRFFTPVAQSLFRVIGTDIGRPLADFMPLTADADLIADAHKVLAQSTIIEREIVSTAGVWYSRRILPYRTHDGDVRGVVITFTDITDRRGAAEALADAKRAADAANMGKSRFLASASHDLRQPLQTIRLLRGLLAQRAKGYGVDELLSRLDSVVDAMLRTLNTLLDINQLEAGVIHPKIEAVPVGEIIDRLKAEFSYHMRVQGLEWRIVHSSAVVESDPHLLEQMIRNLLSNAEKYTGTGGVLLGCRRRGSMLRIEVWDTGPGIADESRQAIFKEFHQLDNPERERSKGLGLGLAIVERLAALLGHHIDVRSRVGLGSVFSIDVPIAAGVSPQPRMKPGIMPIARADRTRLILVIEDDTAIRDLMVQLLDTAGYNTIAAADGREGLDLDVEPDLIIADFDLPNGLDGIKATTALRLRGERPIPVILLTGDISKPALRAIAAYDCLHLDKPVETNLLLQGIARLLYPPAKAFPAAEAARRPVPSGTAIFIVDDDQALRLTLRDMLQEAGLQVEAYPSAEAFLAQVHDRADVDRAGVVLADVRLPGMSGLDLLDRLESQRHSLPTVIMTAHGDMATAVKALRAGARDFIEKPFAADELLAGIGRALHRDETPKLEAHSAVAAVLQGLTARQRQILDLVIAGHPSKNIAADLQISQRTVENHRAAIMHKTGAKSLSALLRMVLSAGGSAEA